MPTKNSKPTKSRQQQKAVQTNQFAIAGLITAFVIAPIGLVLSIVALIQINKAKQPGKGLAIGGLIVSCIWILIYAITIGQFINNVNRNSGTISSGINNNAPLIQQFDVQRAQEINLLAEDLQTYYASHGGYPTYSEINSNDWRESQSFPNIADGKALCDPGTAASQITCALAATPIEYAYSYQVWQPDGQTPCVPNSKNLCPKFTLTAVLESETGIKNNDGSRYYIKTSQ